MLNVYMQFLILLILAAAIFLGPIIRDILRTTTILEMITTFAILSALILLAGYWIVSAASPHP